ncbi:hypothetical protein HUB97_10435 [Halorubraceae archaeon YAN]|nr:hypothetical protein [Halorubraceae archaeon YAN]
MDRHDLAGILLILLGAGLVLAGGLSSASASVITTASDYDVETQNNTDVLSSGERLAGVVGVHQVELESTVSERAFDRTVANRSAAEKATVAGASVDRAEERLVALTEEKQRLETARENGTLSNGQYRARIARLESERQSIERSLNQSESVISDLPQADRERSGANESRIEQLRDHARELSGQDVRAIAQEIAGPPTERPGGRSDTGPPQGTPGPQQPNDENASAGPNLNTSTPPGHDRQNETAEQEPPQSADRGAAQTENRSATAAANNNTDQNTTERGAPDQRGSSEERGEPNAPTDQNTETTTETNSQTRDRGAGRL